MNRDSIAGVHDCYGCGVCAAFCPKRIIDIVMNDDGFYEPIINDSVSCVGCGICSAVCSFCDNSLSFQESKPLKSWAGWSNDPSVRKSCSSGGVAFELARNLVGKGYKAVLCRYNSSSERAEHYIASDMDELCHSIGSKYIQSYTLDAFKSIKFDGTKYLIIGTPCQIDSLRRYLKIRHREDDFVLVDFFCHCVPSMHAWKSYLRMVGKRIGPVLTASWRNKGDHGWHDSWAMHISGEKGVYDSRMSENDLFYKLFLGDTCMNRSCEYSCKYKYKNSSADIRIGDLWGNEYADVEEGVSALIAFSQRGLDVVEELDGVVLREHSFEITAEGQMKCNARHRPLSRFVLWLLKKDVRIDGQVFQSALFLQKVMTRIISIFQ